MVFEEVTGHTATQTRDRITELIPPGAGEQWFAEAAPYSVVLVSKTPIVRTFDVEPGGRAQGFLIQKPPGFDRDVLVVGAHLKCCGTASDDVKRQQEVDNIMASIRDAQNDGSIPALTPIIITGDMNFVGDRQQPMTLIEGDIVTSWLQPSFDPDWDDTPLADVAPQTTGLPQTFTWISPRSPSDMQFSPGRLDYMIYTDAVLSKGNSFALYTPAIRFFDLQRLGLNATDSGASDHLPIVADFLPQTFTVAELPEKPRSVTLKADVFPNPASETVTIRWDAGAGGAEVEIFDILGRRVAAKYSGSTTRGEQSLTFDVRQLPDGLYLVVARSAKRTVRREFVKRRITN
jgi:hypothetical protein